MNSHGRAAQRPTIKPAIRVRVQGRFFFIKFFPVIFFSVLYLLMFRVRFPIPYLGTGQREVRQILTRQTYMIYIGIYICVNVDSDSIFLNMFINSCNLFDRIQILKSNSHLIHDCIYKIKPFNAFRCRLVQCSCLTQCD